MVLIDVAVGFGLLLPGPPGFDELVVDDTDSGLVGEDDEAWVAMAEQRRPGGSSCCKLRESSSRAMVMSHDPVT